MSFETMMGNSTEDMQSRSRRVDVVAFIGTFLIGLLFYSVGHFIFHFSQIIIIIGIICVMLAYAWLVFQVPRLRVRLDQAGDNAYYLGLLFTLMSMAFALYEFGTAVSDVNGNIPEQSGAQQIIANFGIALASTITGIFLRVAFHQMRIDPADVESVTRIELADASKKVKATLDNVTNEFGLFFRELHQKSNDLVTTLFDDVKDAEIKLSNLLEKTSIEMNDAATKTQREVLAQTTELTGLIQKTSIEVKAAIERLRVLEAPTTTLSTRLNKVTKALEATTEQAERLAAHFMESSSAAKTATEEITKISGSMAQLIEKIAGNQSAISLLVENGAEKVNKALIEVGEGLIRDQKLFELLTAQTKISVEESVRAQKAALEVLNRLTEVSRSLAAALKDAEIRGDRENKR
jgi:hypothetical protein